MILKKNLKLMIKKLNKYDLENASEELKADKEFVSEAVKK